MRTSLEIVPRSLAELDAAISLIAARYPRIDTVNVPDRPNCDLRSTDAAHHIRGRIAHRIPHLRACDFDESSAPLLIEALTGREIDEVIVVAGDKAARGERLRTDSLDSLYRDSRREPVRLRGARPASVSRRFGADSQRSAEARSRRMRILHTTAVRPARHRPLFGQLLGDATTFWGLSPVVSDRSQRYWQQVNSVRFPSEFVPTLNWNQRFALRFLSEIADRGGNAYLMPIKVDIERYLAPLAARFA